MHQSHFSHGGTFADPPLGPPQEDDDSLLSTLSPQSSTQTSDIQYGWSVGVRSTLDEQEELFVNTQDASCGVNYGRTPKASTVDKLNTGSISMHRVTHKQEMTSMSDMTPRVGNTSQGTYNHTDNHDMNHNLSTPSWDIDNTFSFRKKKEKNMEKRHHLTPMWDILGALSLSRSESMSTHQERARIQGDCSDEIHAPSAESTENDFFAMQVGLIL